MAKVLDWLKQKTGDLNVSNMISSAEVENYYKTHYGSFESIGDIESLQESWEFYNADAQDNLRLSYNAMTTDYNPIDNYSMTETETEENTVIATENGKKTAENTTTNNLTVTSNSSDVNTLETTESSSETQNKNNSVFPFDDDSTAHPKETEQVTAQDTNNSTVNNNATSDNTTTTTGTVGLKTADTTSNSKNENSNNTRNLTRKGNIGVTTTQQMIESEIVLRSKLLFHDYLAKFATLNFFYFGGDD